MLWNVYLTRMQTIRYSIGRHLIHAGLRVLPPGRVKAELSDLLWEWGDHVRAEVALGKTKQRRDAAVTMTDQELIDSVVEFCLTYTERYSTTREDDSIKLTDDSHYWMTVRPDCVKPGELLPRSAEHRRLQIQAWQKFARAALLKSE